jgi:hypothetical protein
LFPGKKIMTIVKILSFACLLILSALPVFAADGNSGTVAETIDVDAYIYIRLEEDGSWLATTPLEVVVGDRIEYSSGFLMEDFHSTKLDRRFEKILFVERVRLAGSGNTQAAQADPHAAAAMERKAVTAPAAGEISRAEGGKTVAEVLSENESLAGQAVVVRARVVKVSANILNKNWITLQDGTGTPPDDKLIATTTEEVEVGDTLIVSGTVKANVDIGAGYQYKVILEEAAFSR